MVGLQSEEAASDFDGVVAIGLALNRPSTRGACERSAQHELDLPVEAAQIIVGPTLHRVEHLPIDAQQKRLAFSHGGECWSRAFVRGWLVVDGARVHDRRDGTVGAEYDQEVADQGCLALFVELGGEHRERHLYHAHGAFHNRLPSGDNGTGLLPLQHNGGDFLSVREVTDRRFQYFHAGFGEALDERVEQAPRDDVGMRGEGPDASREGGEEQQRYKEISLQYPSTQTLRAGLLRTIRGWRVVVVPIERVASRRVACGVSLSGTFLIFRRCLSPFRSWSAMSVFAARRFSGAALALLLFGACSSDPVEPITRPVTSTISEVQVDASSTTAYVQLGDTIRTVTVSSPATSTDWDLSFFATTVALNSGPAGPGSVSGFCLCGNENISNTQIQSLTALGERAAFDAVTASAIPAESQFLSESLNARISGWFTGTGAAAQANSARTFVVIRSRVLPVPLYGKFRVTNMVGATAASAGSVTFEYTMQPVSNGLLPVVRTATVAVGATPVHFDLVAGAVSAAAGTWDIRFQGFLIRANSGASGGAGHLVAPPQDVPFASLDLAAMRAIPNSAFGQDALGGPFGARPWYKYNVTGTDLQIWPNFNVYLVKKGAAIYKVQLTGYYDVTGKARVISVRSARLR